MAVVINEFEVVPQTQPPGQTSQAPQAGAPAPETGLTAQELERFVELQRERLTRVWSH
jgi:hypothetical protein